MNRDVEMELSIWEMLLSVKKYWRIVLIVAAVCLAAGGVFGYVRLKNAEQAAEEEQDEEFKDYRKEPEHQEYAKALFEENQKLSEEAEEINSEMAPRLRKEWQRLKERYENHPFAKQDPYHCNRVRTTVLFDGADGNHDSMLYDWIMTADEDKLFGDAKDKLAPYKRELISSGAGSSNSYEAIFTLIAVDGFDTSAALSYLKKYIIGKARSDGFRVKGYTTSTDTTYYSAILDFQNGMVSSMTGVQSSLNSMYETAMKVVEPPNFEEVVEEPETKSTGISLTRLAKYGLIGLILGVFIGVVVAIFLTLRKGCLMSARQVEDTFGLERLGDFSGENPGALDILNANLDVMISEGNGVMVLGSPGDEKLMSAVAGWNEKSDRPYAAGRDIFDDSETIDALSSVEGIILGVRIGESRLMDIQRLMLRATKLNKKILGYIQL